MSNASEKKNPLAYFLTFNTYGTWLHGDPRKSVTKREIEGRKGQISHEPGLHMFRRKRLLQKPMVLNSRQRKLVAEVIAEVCNHRGWELHAKTVQDEHGHVVVSGKAKPERMIQDFKARSTRRLREEGLVGHDRKIWSYHGSTKHIWDENALMDTCKYVDSHVEDAE